eukprot:scaffold155363_cov35-Tisochrysis_lutea.AAC.4
MVRGTPISPKHCTHILKRRGAKARCVVAPIARGPCAAAPHALPAASRLSISHPLLGRLPARRRELPLVPAAIHCA